MRELGTKRSATSDSQRKRGREGEADAHIVAHRLLVVRARLPARALAARTAGHRLLYALPATASVGKEESGGGGGVIYRADILHGDARDRLRELSPESVQCCVTSPPYWGLRDYGVAGQLGLERTPEEYVANMVAVFREVRRVLRPDGTLWLNLGDCYATGGGAVGDCPGGGEQGARWRGEGSKADLRKHATNTVDPKARRGVGPMTQPNRMPLPGLKPKDLVGIPWRVAFALQAEGWWLRSDIVWSKPNPMPESVTDRPTKAHEYLFLLSKSATYFYDADAIAEDGTGRSSGSVSDDKAAQTGDPMFRTRVGFAAVGDVEWHKRNRRTVWTIATQPFSGAHFAVMPEALVEPCILAGSRHGDLVLDPFAGAGTVGVVALKHGRAFVGVELNPKYAAMAQDRIIGDAPLLNRIGQLPLSGPDNEEGSAA